MRASGIKYSNTRIKLEEAGQFLNELKDAYSNFIREDTERNFILVRHKFSAFITAARSITFYAQTEYANVPGFKEWYEPKRKEMSEDRELTYLNKARVENVHRAIVPVGMTNQLVCGITASVVSQQEAKRRLAARKEEPAECNEKKSDCQEFDVKTINLFVPGQAIFEGKPISMGQDVDLIAFCEKIIIN